MYSRNRSYAESVSPTVPARYSGVRFRRDKRSDGREVVIETPLREPSFVASVEKEETPAAEQTKEEPSGISLKSLFSNVAEDDILLAALIIILAAEGAECNREAILLLILLLCVK